MSGRIRPGPPRPTKLHWPGCAPAWAWPRTAAFEQDVAFGLQQLVDIALKALSPGINDTTTAIMAVDQLGQLLRRLAGRSFPARLRADEAGQPRVWLPAPDFAAYLRLAFDQVRLNAKGNHALLRALARTGRAASDCRAPAATWCTRSALNAGVLARVGLPVKWFLGWHRQEELIRRLVRSR
ncbi:DUF2254 family protein [Hymenobacter jeollabukensis]|nr:DUF2254 family protein [Hymenobacter jeollabukensis]